MVVAQHGYKAPSNGSANKNDSEYRCNAKFRLIGSRKSNAQRQEWDNLFSVELNIQGRATKYLKMQSHYIQPSDEFILKVVGAGNRRRYKISDKSEEAIMLLHLMNTGVIPNWCKSSYNIKSIRNGDRSPRRKIRRRSLLSNRRRTRPTQRRRTIQSRQKPITITRSVGSIMNNPSNCNTALDNQSFNEIRRSVNQQNFDNKKLTAAKIGLKTSCPARASQIASLVQLLSFSKNKLAFAKYAYQYAYDKQNYSQVVNTLKFRSHREQLRNYINER
ncbi:hypothetical protein BKI52_08030 [marine bacterium AO1-C]|nr:hypothetical protein BKI52_08030 [marine bacterium AO1-C]